jgi:hypothetical protein
VKKNIVFIFIIAVFLIGCGGDSNRLTYSFSFEGDFEGWTPHGDSWELYSNGEVVPISWSIVPSSGLSTEGSLSIEFMMNEESAGGAVYIDRPFMLEPYTVYRVLIEYDFATKDMPALAQPSVDLPWSITTGVSPSKWNTGLPLIAYDFESLSTTIVDGLITDNYVWLEKKGVYTATTGTEGILYVYIGIKGYWPGRTYYMDNLRVSFQKVPFLQ